MTSDQEHLNNLRHSAAHLLAAAVVKLWPGAKLTLGPATEDGFYYDIDFADEKVSEEDFKRIEKEMSRIVQGWKEFSHEEKSVEDAKNWAVDNPYKLELIEEIAGKGEKITFYTAGDFVDLCRGGHVESPSKELRHIKLLKVAGAYWRGDENNTMLTRIYGTAFPTKEELAEYLKNLEEAKKRDHRKLGRELDLFTFSDLVGPGLPLFTPRGTVIRRELEELVQSIQEPLGFERVFIPHLAKPDLYKTSGHWDKFKDDLFHVRGKRDSEFVMKPMNCPHHTQIFASRQRSYKDLPLKFSEVTTVYRDEQQGELQGLSRVRSITQDDAHVFCRPDQVGAQVASLLTAFDAFHAVFGFEIDVRLSVRDPKAPEKYLGGDEVWKMAEGALREALTSAGKDFVEEEGEAAFYGPKVDFIARDSLNRKWQISTIQLDFNMPARFGLEYIDAKSEKQTPVMIHRAILGSVERFMAIILEHYAGNLPLWLSPVQAAVLPISDEQNEYANEVARQLRSPTSPSGLRGAPLRVEVDTRGESIGKKIREAELMKVPVMLIVGKKEVESGEVAVRSHATGDEGTQKLVDLVADLREKIEKRA